MEWLATDAAERGRYALQLSRVFDYFDESQVLILQYERGLAEPIEQYHRTLELIGAPPARAEGPDPYARHAASAQEGADLGRLEQAIVRELEADVAELKELVPEIDVKLWKHFAHLADGAKPHRARAAAGADPAPDARGRAA